MKRIPRHDVEFYESDRTGDCYSRGIYTCGSVWCCPVCSRRIARRKGDRLQRAVTQHLEAGGGVHMVTATIPHHAGHSLEEVYSAVSEAWRYVKSGAPWQRKSDEIGYIGSVRGVDATHGANGWHPHLHTLFFTRRPLGDEELQELERWLFERWARKIKAFWKDGRTGELECRPLTEELPRHHEPVFGSPSPEYAIRVSRCAGGPGDKAGAYVAAMGLGKEATSMMIKGGTGEHRTPWQILRDYVVYGRKVGSREHALWVEWITTMQGKLSLYWSPGLKGRYDLEPGEPQEDAFEGGSDEDRRVATVHSDLWDALTTVGSVAQEFDGGPAGRPVTPEELEEGLRMVLQAGGPGLALISLKEFARDRGIEPSRVEWSERDRTFYLLAKRWRTIPEDQEANWFEGDEDDAPGGNTAAGVPERHTREDEAQRARA